MDLRGKQITVGELLDNPRSKAVFQRRFGKFMKHPMVGAARSLSLAQLQDNMVKLQVVFKDGGDVPPEIPVLHASKVGRIHTLIMRNNAEEAENMLAAYEPMLVDAVPLTLEEIFITEMEVLGYDIETLIY